MTLGNPVWCSLVRLWCWKAGILILFASRFDFEVISWHVFFFKPGLKQTKRIISRKKQPGQVSTLHLREIMLFKIFESINDAKQCVRQHQSSATKHTFCTLDGIPSFSSPVTHWIMPNLKSSSRKHILHERKRFQAQSIGGCIRTQRLNETKVSSYIYILKRVTYLHPYHLKMIKLRRCLWISIGPLHSWVWYPPSCHRRPL